jgi:Cu/Ag efflux protein CusF
MWLTTPFSLSCDTTMHTQPRKKATKNQKNNNPLLQINLESYKCLIAIDHYRQKRIKDMMNMNFRVGGLAYMLKFKTKTKKEATIVATAQHICEQFLSSFFFSCSTTNMVVL